jgi:hypothetical protein
MQFNDTTSDKVGIVNDIDWFLGTTVSDYPLVDKTRRINVWYGKVVTRIMQSDAKFQWDDLNASDLPIGTTSLVVNQQDYSIADSTYLKILKVECKDSAGNWIPLTQIDYNEKKNIAMAEYHKTAGTPSEFDLVANSIFLYPKPSYASAGGLKLYFQRTPDYFTDDDTTQTPGFVEPFHCVLSFGAAYDYALANDMATKIATLGGEILKYMGDENHDGMIKDFYSSRNKDMKTRMSVSSEDYGVSNDDMGQPSVGWGG